MFDLGLLPLLSKTTLSLPVPDPSGVQHIALSVLVLKGQSTGPILVLLAGVHGDEYEGVLTIQDVFEQLSPEAVRGTLIAVPVVNPLAYQARTRSTPEDGKNMARVFPGNPVGTITERIAYQIAQHIIPKADLLIDLHSAGTAMTSPTLIGFHQDHGPIGQRAKAAALAFGAPVVWEHPWPNDARGRTITHAQELGIPALYTEASGGVRVSPEVLGIYTISVLNVMAHLGMIQARPAVAKALYLWGEGNLDATTTFSCEGLFRSRVEVLRRVEQGEVVGVVRGLDGRVLEEVRSPKAGLVVFLRSMPPVRPGDVAVLVAERGEE